MNTNEWIEANYNELSKAAKQISGKDPYLYEELLHYSLEAFLTRSDREDIVNSGGAQYYIVRIMLNQWRSTTSEIHAIYRNKPDNIENHGDLFYVEDDSEERQSKENMEIRDIECVRNSLDRLPWFDKMLFDVFIEESHTVSSLSRETKIPRKSVSLTINRVKKYLKQEIEKNRNGKV